MNEPGYPLVTHLVHLAHHQDRGALADLRRGLGKPPGTAPSMFPHVARYVPADAATSGYDGPYYIVAALFSLHPEHTDDRASLATAMKRLPRSATGDQTPSHELRFRALLKASPESLPHHLRQAIGMLRGSAIPINYHSLLQHLLHWDNSQRWVQRRWALDFWASTELPTDTSTEPTTTDA